MNQNLPPLDAVIFDLDGVIWRENTPVEGALQTVARLKQAGKRCLYCTNNARQTPADFAAKLTAMGMETQEDEVINSAEAMALYLGSKYTGDFSAFVVGEAGLISALRKVGARVVSVTENENLTADSPDFPVDCVVAGIDTRFDYVRLYLAQSLILKGAAFLATNRDATFPVVGGVTPGAGSIVAAIETASGVSPVTLGKPQPMMLGILAQKYGLNAGSVAFVGDRPDTDMVAARRAGMKAVFVATGVTTMEQAQKMRGEKKPEYFYENLTQLADEMLGAAAPGTMPVITPMHKAPEQAIVTGSAPGQDPLALPEEVASTSAAANFRTVNIAEPEGTASEVASAGQAPNLSPEAQAFYEKHAASLPSIAEPQSAASSAAPPADALDVFAMPGEEPAFAPPSSDPFAPQNLNLPAAPDLPNQSQNNAFQADDAFAGETSRESAPATAADDFASAFEFADSAPPVPTEETMQTEAAPPAEEDSNWWETLEEKK